ncbi:MAG: Spo0E family sporulation regulatory protein-aspartic acid phosphatase [Clostridiaceae bacterium]|nr:Spo0E family sporulation regulatory protein-aspartic acid phosphatase [Clostridiaceae bacterium]
MKSIEELRKELHSAMQLGNKEEILRVSQELDIAILDFLKESKGQVVANESVYNSK